jgi:beta-glucosidase
VQRPAKELKHFAKVSIAAGETVDVKFTITPADLAYFDADAHAWTTHAGTYKAHIAASSADIRSTIEFKLK